MSTPRPRAVPDGDPHDRDPGEQAAEARGPRRRALAMPDLRPYADPRPLAELGPLVVEAGKAGLPVVVRAVGVTTARVVAFHGRGLLLLLRVGTAWLSGKVGKTGSAGARLAISGLVAYAVIQTSATHPVAPVLVGLVGFVLAGGAAAGYLPLPEGKPEKSKSAKADTEETTEEAAAPERDGGRARLARRLTAVFTAPANAPETGPAAGAPTEAPAEDPLTALIRAEIGGDNGVHLCDLRPAMRAALPGLAEATDEELRAHLLAAGWDPSRKFRSRGTAGRAGVHRDQLPPLPSSGAARDPRVDHSPGNGDRPRPANSPRGGEGRRGGGEWSEEDRRRGHRIIPDPERGPSAWKIQHHEE